MNEPKSPLEEFADRSADNYSPENIRCRFCKWFCPYDPTKRNTDGECRASLPLKRDNNNYVQLHEEVQSDHWCEHYEDGPFADKFRLLHHHSLLDEHQQKLDEFRFLQNENAKLAAEDER